MNKIILCAIIVLVSAFTCEAKKAKLIKISVEPKEASIYVNNNFIGYGYGEFLKPEKKEQVAIIRVECEEYKPLLTKFYGADKRESLSFTLMQDGFYRASAASGIVNKYFTIVVDSLYYTVNDGKIDTTPAWKMIHQILLNYFDEIETTDYYGGYLQTPWSYKTFTLSEMKMRNRVTIRDISTPVKVAFQIKISSEVAGAFAAKTGEFTEVDRIPKDYEPLIEELQTRIGKVSSL